MKNIYMDFKMFVPKFIFFKVKLFEDRCGGISGLPSACGVGIPYGSQFETQPLHL